VIKRADLRIHCGRFSGDRGCYIHHVTDFLVYVAANFMAPIIPVLESIIFSFTRFLQLRNPGFRVFFVHSILIRKE
jgi:hypothetical protein